MMTNIVSEIKKDEEWLTVELNPTRDMLGEEFAAKIYSMPQMNKILSMQNWIFQRLDWAFP